MKNIFIMGGSFNPIHYGHLFVVQNAIENGCLDGTKFDEVWITPCYKAEAWGKQILSWKHRVDMILMAKQEMKLSAHIQTLEITFEFIYTWQTAKHLLSLKRDEEYRYYFHYGPDHTPQDFARVEEILALAPAFNLIPTSALDIRYGTDARSTLIRDRLERGLSVDGMIPKSVEKYIRDNDLYGVEE